MYRRITAIWQLGNHPSNMVLTRSALGRELIVQPTTIPSKQSIIAQRYNLPSGSANSVISVSNFSYGCFAVLSRVMRKICTTYLTSSPPSHSHDILASQVRSAIPAPPVCVLCSLRFRTYSLHWSM